MKDWNFNAGVFSEKSYTDWRSCSSSVQGFLDSEVIRSHRKAAYMTVFVYVGDRAAGSSLFAPVQEKLVKQSSYRYVETQISNISETIFKILGLCYFRCKRIGLPLQNTSV